MSGLLLVAGFVTLLLWGMPIAFALAIPAIVYAVLSGSPWAMIAHTATYALDSFPLLAVPLFILVGNLMNASGITTRMFGFANTLVAHWRGGLAQVNILASLIFSGSSGAALADIGGIGAMEMRAMDDAGYPRPFSAGLTIASATVGPIFPPSIPLIIFGAVAEVSTVRLLLAGIVPALLTVVALMVLTRYLARRRSFPKGNRRATPRVMLRKFIDTAPALLTPIILIGGMLYGVFTATEAAAVTVIYILLIDIFIYRGFRFERVLAATASSVKTTCVIIIMVSAAALFARALALELVPQKTAALLLSLSANPYVLLLIVNVLVLIAGMFLETISAILLLTPLIVPVLTSVGVDPIHLGLIIVYNLMIGLLTPPMGMSIFLISNISKVPMEKIFKELIPYYIPMFLVLILLTYIPSLSLWIPSMIN